MPTQNSIEYVANVVSPEGLVRVFQDLRSWGNNDMVVNVAATRPMMVMESIVLCSLHKLMLCVIRVWLGKAEIVVRSSLV